MKQIYKNHKMVEIGHKVVIARVIRCSSPEPNLIQMMLSNLSSIFTPNLLTVRDIILL